jgi:hypothetical protein
VEENAMTAIALFSSVRLRLGATMESHNIKQARDGQRQTPWTLQQGVLAWNAKSVNIA